MKTLLQIQDEVAIKEGFENFNECLMNTTLGLFNPIVNTSAVRVINEAAEIYAEQFKPKWISVDERLPETNLGSSFKYSEVVSVLTTSENYPTTARYEIDEDVKQWFCLLTDCDVDVTHWMPLPEKP